MKAKIVPGIVNQNSLEDWFFDDLPKWIDINFESWISEMEKSGLSEDEIQSEIDSGCCYYHEWLIGDWIKINGRYEINKNGEKGYAATFEGDSGVICIEWSKDTIECHHTSPCYRTYDGWPCGDLDTPGNSVRAYTLPKDFFRKENIDE